MLGVQDTETIIKVMSNTLDGFDRAITRHEITSYETVFESGSLGFVTNLDWYKKPTPMNCLFDFVAGTGKVLSTDMNTGTWELGFFTYDTPIKTYVLPANGGVQIFSFPENLQKRWYKILGSLGDSDLNSFEIQYYNLTNASPESEVRLMSISGSISE
ncbi:hypothetical protein GW830_03455 [bacterium]|nr:hypothetical protein [bacterium]